MLADKCTVVNSNQKSQTNCLLILLKPVEMQLHALPIHSSPCCVPHFCTACSTSWYPTDGLGHMAHVRRIPVPIDSRPLTCI